MRGQTTEKVISAALRYSRCREKLHAAHEILTVGERDVRDRLRQAYRYLRVLREEEIPPQLREEWGAILHDLTRRGPEIGPKGTVYQDAAANTLSRMRNSTGRRIAERIDKLTHEFDRIIATKSHP